MNELCADYGYKSILHYGEQLCGDHVCVQENPEDGSLVIVLADGLGSGVKASILSTLTSTILSTMISHGLPLEECVRAVINTLPVDANKNVAYSTFTIIRIEDNKKAAIIQFDNPLLILLRRGRHYHYPRRMIKVEEKEIYLTDLRLHEDDIMIMMSDGCPHASNGLVYNYNWSRDDIINYMEGLSHVGYAAKTLATMLVDECYRLYGEKPIDDATACVVKMCRRMDVNLMFGPPGKTEDELVMKEFKEAPGKHIVCGGTTASIVARYLDKEIKMTAQAVVEGIPPISEIEGVDLVTEGIITINKVATYAKNHLEDDELYTEWGFNRDGASLICRMLFEQATHIHFFVGTAVNEAHQQNDMSFKFDYKMQLISRLADAIKEMGKNVEIKYY